MQRLGDFELHALGDGFFRLDGGAMFGIVPKVVWEKALAPDDRNRVRLAITTLLVRAGSVNVLVDAGIGDKNDAKFSDLYGIERSTTVLRGLAELGLQPEDIHYVVLSHLHFDHAGGATRRIDGELRPTFPKATYVVQQGMWDEALDPNPRTKGSYKKDDFVPLRLSGRVKVVNGDEDVIRGVRVRLTGGALPAPPGRRGGVGREESLLLGRPVADDPPREAGLDDGVRPVSGGGGLDPGADGGAGGRGGLDQRLRARSRGRDGAVREGREGRLSRGSG